MHTNFDIAFDGLNDYFMEVMGFEDTKILDVTNSETLYKVAVYVPKTHELQVRKVLGDAGAGYIGNYSNCTFNINGIGTFKPEDDIYKLENKGETVGLGRYASIDGQLNLESLCEKIKLKLNMNHIRVVGDLNTKIKKVAVVTGAGSDMVSLAKSKNCDVKDVMKRFLDTIENIETIRSEIYLNPFKII